MKITLEKDGSITLYTPGAQALNDTGVGIVDAVGNPVLTGDRRGIQRSQIAAHRRDPEFEKALQAAAGQPDCLTVNDLAALPKP